MTPDVLVLGGGIVGCSVASACARRGMSVTLYERGPLAGGASALDLALIRTGVEMSRWLELHHFTGGAFFFDRSPPDAWPARRIDARAATAALAAEARSYGAEIQTGCEVKALLHRGAVVRGVLTDAGQATAGTTVLAGGADSWRLCAPLGSRVPLPTVPGDLVVAESPPGLAESPMLGDTAWVARDEAGLLWIARPDRAGALLPGLERLSVRESRPLVTSVGPRGAPLEGTLDGIEGLLLACGYGEHGVELAPAAAAAIATALA